MAVITETAIGGSGAVQVTETTAGASDTLTYKPGKNQILTIRNATAGALTPNLVGTGVTSFDVTGYGSVTVSGGYDTPSIAAGEVYAVNLDSIAKYLASEVTVTGADATVLTLTI